MITFVTHLKVGPANAPALEALLTQVRDTTLDREPGVAHYDFARSADEAGLYVVIEVYRDAEAHAAHMETEWVRDSIPKALRLIEGRPAISQYVSPGVEPAVRRFKAS